MTNNSLKDKIALVTGASGGIGRAITIALAREGADLAIHYHKNKKAACETAEAVQKLGCRATVVQADITTLGSVEQMYQKIKTELGEIGILINNAGVLLEKPIRFMSEAEWDNVVDISLKGAFHCIKCCSADMSRNRCGRIINISSVAGLTGDPMRTAYAAAKAGLLGLTKATARELAASETTVNAITPGIIETAMTADTPDAKREKQLGMIPLRRFGTPEEVAELACFLASRKAAYITGQIFSVDGGLRM
ncbi:MAG: 3-oxoacyl-ACP reductase family protein [Lentisphaeria bacterium]